jgi:hypothetical protein
MARKKRTAAGDDKASAQVTNQEGCRRGGVIRQTQPSAQQHQRTAGAIRQTQPDAEQQRCAAGNASGARRTATAMSSQERAVNRSTDQQRRRRERDEQKEAGEAAEMNEFDAAFLVAEDAALAW